MDDYGSAGVGGLPIITKLTKLNVPAQWNDWYAGLRNVARVNGLWENIHPDLPEQPTDHLEDPAPKAAPTMEDAIAELEACRPRPKDIKLTEVHAILCSTYKLEQTIYRKTGTRARARAITSWISLTVNPSIYDLVVTKLEMEQREKGESSGYTIRQLVKEIKRHFAPWIRSMRDETQRIYRSVLQEAWSGETEPDQWYLKWNKAYLGAQVEKIPDIEGSLAIHDFLEAVGARYEPSWARAKRDSIIIREVEGTDNDRTLETYAAMFMAISNRHKKGRFRDVDATPKPLPAHPNQGKRTGSHECPCPKSPHKWPPAECKILLYAIEGTKDPALKSNWSEEERSNIRERYGRKQWSKLREEMDGKGRNINSPSGKSLHLKTGSTSNAGLDPDMMGAYIPFIPLYDKSEDEKHILSKSTLLASCGGMHLVNSSDLLEPGTFRETPGEYFESSKVTFKVIGRGTRVLRKILNGANGAQTEDLVLNNVAVIENLLFNLVSLSCLRKAGAWYCGFNGTLRFGKKMEQSVILAQVVRKHNLAFLQYDPLGNQVTGPER